MFQLEYQRQQLLQERQQFHMEQLRAAEFRARQVAAQHLAVEQRSQGLLSQATVSLPQTVLNPTMVEKVTPSPQPLPQTDSKSISSIKGHYLSEATTTNRQ